MHNIRPAILGLTLAVLLCASATRAAAIQQTPSGNKAAESADAESSAASKTASKTGSVAKDQPAPSAPSVEDRLRALEQIIERQQREIEALRGLIEKREGVVASERTSGAEQIKPAEASVRVVAEQSPPSTPAETAQADKRLEDLHKKFGSLRVSGDVRVRTETFSNQGFDSPNEPPFRDRIRLRARLALDGVVNRHFDWGIRLATGPLTDPVSTNQTLSDFFERKPITLDRAFIRYDTKSENVGLQLVAGRFEPTFRRTQMVWDEDVNVEGASETVYFKTKSSLKEIRLVAFQLPFDEEPSAKDGFLYGGQLQTDWQFSPTVSASFNVAHYNWNRPDLVLRALVPFAGNGTSDGQVIAQSTTNSVIRDANGRPIGFLANFNLFDILSTLNWRASSRWPVAVTFDFVRNLTGRIDDEENGYWAGVQVGQTREKGNLMFGYTFTRIERDAVLVPFNFSDILQSNSRTHIPEVTYQIANGVSIKWAGLFSQRINKTVQNSPVNRFLNRMQFDLVYRF